MPSFFITPSDLLEIDRIIHRGESFGANGTDRRFHWQSRCRSLFIIMTGVMITHLPQGWFMNWFGKKGGEGIEYFVVLLTMLLVVVIKCGDEYDAHRSADRLLNR